MLTTGREIDKTTRGSSNSKVERKKKEKRRGKQWHRLGEPIFTDYANSRILNMEFEQNPKSQPANPIH